MEVSDYLHILANLPPERGLSVDIVPRSCSEYFGEEKISRPARNAVKDCSPSNLTAPTIWTVHLNHSDCTHNMDF